MKLKVLFVFFSFSIDDDGAWSLFGLTAARKQKRQTILGEIVSSKFGLRVIFFLHFRGLMVSRLQRKTSFYSHLQSFLVCRPEKLIYLLSIISVWSWNRKFVFSSGESVLHFFPFVPTLLQPSICLIKGRRNPRVHLFADEWWISDWRIGKYLKVSCVNHGATCILYSSLRVDGWASGLTWRMLCYCSTGVEKGPWNFLSVVYFFTCFEIYQKNFRETTHLRREWWRMMNYMKCLFPEKLHPWGLWNEKMFREIYGIFDDVLWEEESENLEQFSVKKWSDHVLFF